MFTIQCRYEYFGSNGKTWTFWFNHSHSESSEEEIQTLIEKSKEIDKIQEKVNRLRK